MRKLIRTGQVNLLNRNATERCGFSLLELILVLAILMAFAALALPNVQRSLSRQGVRKGADMFRAAMGKARVRAMRSGKVYAVFYVPNTPYYSVAAFDKAPDEGALASQRLASIQNRSATELFSDNLLPRQIRFAAGEVEIDGRASLALSSSGNSSIRPILFYPDGSSQNAKIILQNEKGDMVQVFLRGLTGTSTSTRIVER